MKNFLKNNDKYIIPMIAIFSFIIFNIFISCNYYTKSLQNDNIIRLHVVANSNDIDDQIVKLKVNEKIEEYLKNIDMSNLSSDEILTVIKNNSNEILDITNYTLKENDKNYTSKLEVGKIFYDEKENQLYHMDKGSYNSAKIILGEGNGKNIWSFICPDKDNLDKLKNYETIMPGLSKIYDNNESCNISYKSKIMELLLNN